SVEVVARIEFIVTQEFKAAAVNRIAAGLGDDVYRGAGRGAEFSREGVRVDPKLLNSLSVHSRNPVLTSSVRDGDSLSVHTAGVDAVHQKRHEAHRLAARIQTAHALLEHVAAQVHTGDLRQKRVNVAPVERKILNLGFSDRSTKSIRGGFDQG